MRKAANAGLVLSLFFILGCAHIPFIGKSALSETEKKFDSPEKPALESSQFVEKGRIVDVQRLQRKQSIAIVPFKAGVGVVASEESDKIALTIVKGISDAFAYDRSGKHKHFNILTAESSQKADLLIQGYITDMKSSSKISRWVLSCSTSAPSKASIPQRSSVSSSSATSARSTT